MLLALAAFAAGAAGATALEAPIRSAARCDIKGDVSADAGERIYHLPDQLYYDRTRIDAWRGERWFCTEAEARAAGWRRAKI